MGSDISDVYLPDLIWLSHIELAFRWFGPPLPATITDHGGR